MERVLIVDDDPNILEMMEYNVLDFGFDAAVAESGKDALEKLIKRSYDVVITDMKMPGMDGMQLLRHIKKFYPLTAVIVVTGFDKEYSYLDVIRAGASDYLAKPFNIDELEAKIYRALREQKLARQVKELEEQYQLPPQL